MESFMTGVGHRRAQPYLRTIVTSSLIFMEPWNWATKGFRSREAHLGYTLNSQERSREPALAGGGLERQIEYLRVIE